MASDKDATGHYAVVELTDKGEKPLGTVQIDAAGTIMVGSDIETGKDGQLTRIAKYMNEKEVMYVDAPPPKGSPRFTLASRIVKRGEPDFIPALKDYLHTYYHLALRPQ